MNDYDFIMEYKNMKTVSKICKEFGIDYGNLSRGKTTKENEKKVSDELKKQVIKLYSDIIIKGVIK